MPELMHLQHETFAWLAAHDVPLRKAFIVAGYRADGFNTSNWNRLARRPDVKSRISEIRELRQKMTDATQMKPAEIVSRLHESGIDTVADFFAAGDRGEMQTRDLSFVDLEVARALVRLVRRATGLPVGFDRVVASGAASAGICDRIDAIIDDEA
jgi:hypothetical protein